MELSSLDIYYVVRDIRRFLGSKVEKIYQWGNEEIMLKFRSKETKSDLDIIMPGIIFLTKKDKEAPTEPPGFCYALRNALEGAKLISVDQEGFERIIKMVFETGQKSYTLIIEAFKPGNVVLVENKKILNVLLRKKFKDRVLAPGHEYKMPQPKPDPRKQAKKTLEESDKDIARTIAVDMGFGGKYANEIIARAGITEKNYSELKNPEKLVEEIEKIFSGKEKPFVNKEPYPIEMKTVNIKEEKESFSDAIVFAMQNQKVPEETERNKKEAKLNAIINAQQQRMKELEKEAEENQKKGEALYRKFSELQDFLQKTKKLIEEKKFSELEEVLKKREGFIKYDKKTKTAEFEIN